MAKFQVFHVCIRTRTYLCEVMNTANVETNFNVLIQTMWIIQVLLQKVVIFLIVGYLHV